ncbi:MAG: hypothetical protein ACTSYX_02805, partial [Candidatus Thorarchaeota archaeon]
MTIEDGVVTMAPTDYITNLTREGNIADCDNIKVEAVCEEGKPTIIVVFDNYPEDHYNEPSVGLLDLERPDDPTLWVDYFSVLNLDPWGDAIIIATYNDDDTVGAVTSEFSVFKVTQSEGTKGEVTQDGLTIDIPQGAIPHEERGLIIVKVPKLIADATVEPVTPIGDPVMVTTVSGTDCNPTSAEDFDHGLRAWVTMTYDESLLPEGVVEEDLRVALWKVSDGYRYWTTSGLQDFSVDPEANTITFTTRTPGVFSVVAYTTFRITTPVILPRCGEYTGVYPKICTVIEDLLNGVNEKEIKVVLSGPAEDPIFDRVTIYHQRAMSGWSGEYDDVSHMLCLELEEDYDFGTLLGARTADGGWSGYGLPGGTYTLDIYAVNNAGDSEHLEHTFKVDATVPVVDFVGEYVAPDPSFSLTITDTESGIVCDSIYIDVFAVKPGTGNEYEDFLGTLTPTSCDPATGVVEFDNVVFGGTLDDGRAIDVVLYGGTYTVTGSCSYGDCRTYGPGDGVPDCVGNHANPVWRRYVVDATPPTLTILSDDTSLDVRIKVEDTGSGVDTSAYAVETAGDDTTGIAVAWEQLDVHAWEMRFTLPEAGRFSVKAYDNVGNLSTGEYEVSPVAGLVISEPEYEPKCGSYVGPFVTISTKIEAWVGDPPTGNGVSHLRVLLSGPGYDGVTIWNNGSGAVGWMGTYDTDVSHVLKLQPTVALSSGEYTIQIYAQSVTGDTASATATFTVDATAPAVPVAGFVGEYVAANPTFTLDLSDTESGVDEETIFMDIYAVRHSGHGTEYKEYLGTATPSSMQFDWDEGVVTVTFDQMTYGFTLADEMAVDVILYDGDVTINLDPGRTNSFYYYFCDQDDQQCRGYLPEDGVADCAGNHANPVWRRYTVDAVPPSMKVVSAEGASQIEIEVTDTGSGIDSDKFLIDGVPLSESDYDWTWTPTSSSSGILRIDVGEGPVDIDITATDAVGNFAVLEVEEGAEV